MRPAAAVTLLTLLPLAPPAAAERVLVDRIVAVVDDDPILLSDVERVIALGFVERREGESRSELQRRVLDRLIDQRLQLHEVDRAGLGPVPADLIEAQLEVVRSRFPDRESYRRRLEDAGLDEDGLRHLLGRQLAVVRYIEERLSPRVFVDLDDVRSYYEGPFTEGLDARGAPVPPLAEVREQIRSLLRERRLNEEIEEWTRELRLEGDVIDHFHRAEEELPPVVKRLERGGG